ncbi:MAG TPA: hypothetical protein EYP20_04080 [Aigarchaeota archaeon]|nr:hypothetical protein [Aigarchaeota archaeon]
MEKKALIFLESAKFHFEKFRTLLEEAMQVDEGLRSEELQEKVFWVGEYVRNAISNLKGGMCHEEFPQG